MRLKKGILKLLLIIFVYSYIVITLYGIGVKEVVTEGYNILFNAPIEQQGSTKIMNINEFRKEPAIPILFAGMQAVYWENGVEKVLANPQTNPEKWYDYYAGKMANAKTKDGSYWVWIPRFAYRITYYTDAGKTHVKGYFTDKGFVGPDMESLMDESAVKTAFWKMEKEFVPNYETIKTKGFRIHEAFGKAGSQRKGFWISKYMIGTDKRFTPNNTLLKTDQHYQAFYNIDRMVRVGNPYGLDYTMQHTSIPRNTEYGALYYLTGLANTGENINTVNSSDVNNVSSATFGNITGVYDLNNGVREWTADIAANNFRIFEDKMKEQYNAEYGVETLFMQKDENGIYKEKLPIIGKIKMVLEKIITSGSDKNYGEAMFEFITDYASKNTTLYGGKSILVGKNNLYNTRTSDASDTNKSIYSYEGVESNPGNIGYRAVIYAYYPEGAEMITPRTDRDSNTPGKTAELLQKNKGKYVKITFKSQYRIMELMSKGYTVYGDKQAVFYIPKGSKFLLNLWAGPSEANEDRHLRSAYRPEYRFLGWSINPQGREFYEDTVITDRSENARIYERNSGSDNSSGGYYVDWEPYEEERNKGTVKVIDENLGYMYTFGKLEAGTTINGLVGNYLPKMPGYSTDFYDNNGKKINTYFMPAPNTSRVFSDDLVLTTIMNNVEWLKYKTVTYYIENPTKQVIGNELVVAGNKPVGPTNLTISEGKRLVGWSPSLDTVVTDSMEIKAILEDIPKPANSVELTVNLDGGTSSLMQNGEKMYIQQGTRLADTSNSSELSRIRATIPTKLGYKFKGWSISETETLTSNKELKALWEVEKVRYTFSAPGADTTYNETGVIDAGTAPREPLKNPIRQGYTFYGWSPTTSLAIYSDTTYTAVWVKKDDSGNSQEHPGNGDNTDGGNNGGNNSGNNGGNNSGNNSGNNNGNNSGDTGHTIFPNLPPGVNIIDPKYDTVSPSDYDEKTVPSNRTRIIFDLDGGRWRYPVVFEIENTHYFVTYEKPVKDGYEFITWEPEWQTPKGGVTVYKARWLRKESSDNNSNSGTDNNNNNNNSNNNGGNNNSNNSGNNSGNNTNGGNSGSNNGIYNPNNNNGTNSGNTSNGSNTGINGNGSGTTNQYIYNGRVITGDPNNNTTNVFNNNNLPGGITNQSGTGIGLTGVTGNNGVNSVTVPKVETDLPKSGESNAKVVIGIFMISILLGVMYIYQDKLRRLNRRSKRIL